MSNAKEHLTLRLPTDLLAIIDQAAKTQERSRSQVIVRTLQNIFGDKPSNGSPENNGAKIVTPLPKAQPTSSKSANPRIRAISSPERLKACGLCFALNGMHQRGCQNG